MVSTATEIRLPVFNQRGEAWPDKVRVQAQANLAFWIS